MIKFIDMSEIYKTYMSLSPYEANDYIIEKSKEYCYNLNYFYSYLTRYTEELSIEEQENYKQKRKIVTFCRKEEIKYITDYINGVSDFKNIASIGDKRKILYFLDKYAYFFEEKKDKINEIKKNIDKLMMTNSSNLELIKDLDNNMTTMLSILVFNKEKEALKQIKKFNFSKDVYYIYLDHFINMFPNQLEQIKYLRDLGEKYFKENVNSKELPKYMKILRNVLISGYSIEEYCSINGVTISSIKKAFRDAHNINQIEVDEIETILKQRNKDAFYRMIKLSVYQILNNKEFDMLDYYDITHLSIEDYLKICKEVIYDQKIMKKIADLLHLKRKRLSRDVRKTERLMMKTFIAGKEISVEDKQKVFNYIEEKNYPLETYDLVLEKFSKGTLTKQKTKR